MSERAALTMLASHAPDATQGAAYIEWTTMFRKTLDRTGSSIDSDEEAVIAEAFRIKPCGQSTEAADAFAQLQTDYPDGDATRFISAADPSSCGQ